MTSSPLSSLPPPSSIRSPSPPLNLQKPPIPDYRPARNLPDELSEHCKIYFEEALYNQALNLLISLLTAGNTSKPPLLAFVPPAQQIALVATLAVHPILTTRAKSQSRLHEANLALRYLYSILKIVGPIDGNLQDAFVFTGRGTSSRRGGGGRRRPLTDDLEGDNDGTEIIENDLAQAGAIWAHAEDIWQVFGWAFNCSILHKKRWDVWRPWLDLMIDVFQRDWDARGAVAPDHSVVDDQDTCEESMIVKAVSSGGVSTGRERKIFRAIFADGSTRPLAEFPEIWKYETRERKKDADVRKAAAKIDIEADNYGDYMDEDDRESDLEDNEPDPSHVPADSAVHSPHSIDDASSPSLDLAEPLGGMPAIHLRLRILALLSTVSIRLPNLTPLPIFYDLYLEHVRPLPLPTFFLLISPSNLRFFSLPAASSLTQHILRSLLSSSAPLPRSDDLTQDLLQHSFLPYAANTSSLPDNAKVSLCVETLLRLLDRHVGLAWTPGLQDAMEIGIAARESKAKRDGRKKRVDADDEARAWLRASAQRIQSVVQMAMPVA